MANVRGTEKQKFCFLSVDTAKRSTHLQIHRQQANKRHNTANKTVKILNIHKPLVGKRKQTASVMTHSYYQKYT